MGSELSRAGDVYSYGILLLEMFTGKRPTDETFKDDFNLHKFVKISLSNNLPQVVHSALLMGTDQVEERTTTSEVSEIEIDHVGQNNGNNFQRTQNHPLAMDTNLGKCLHSILKIGISCSEEDPRERLNMDDVVKELLHIKNTYMAE
ncbi:hypothetical protein TIFTF001_055888 [Ficus carica]|uniref:Uncharacterized protein n=1 Tax=Ficus carica TaxID=3494 RepID=A0AA88EK18_FICCA|nr:hypothetical protein TIFTF001_055888 [Ficus carica]